MVGACLIGSFLVMYYSKGGIFWTTIDDWVGTFLIFILAMVQIIFFAWVFVTRGFGIAVGTHTAYDLLVGWFDFHI